jgi:hypothetical protein
MATKDHQNLQSSAPVRSDEGVGVDLTRFYETLHGTLWSAYEKSGIQSGLSMNRRLLFPALLCRVRYYSVDFTNTVDITIH